MAPDHIVGYRLILWDKWHYLWMVNTCKQWSLPSGIRLTVQYVNLVSGLPYSMSIFTAKSITPYRSDLLCKASYCDSENGYY